jgi:hypothetical protein
MLLNFVTSWIGKGTPIPYLPRETPQAVSLISPYEQKSPVFFTVPVRVFPLQTGHPPVPAGYCRNTGRYATGMPVPPTADG